MVFSHKNLFYQGFSEPTNDDLFIQRQLSPNVTT